MEKSIEIKLNPKEIADQLFELDNEQVAEVFSHWKRNFDDEYERRRLANEPIWIFDLNHFMMHVVPRLDEDGKDFFRTAYSTMVYQLVNNATKKHLLNLH